MENSVDPDQLASEKPADLDLHCFQKKRYPGSSGYGLASAVNWTKFSDWLKIRNGHDRLIYSFG